MNLAANFEGPAGRHPNGWGHEALHSTRSTGEVFEALCG